MDLLQSAMEVSEVYSEAENPFEVPSTVSLFSSVSIGDFIYIYIYFFVHFFLLFLNFYI